MRNKKKVGHVQINLLDWVNPAPCSGHPIPRAHQPEWKFGACVGAGAVAELVIRSLIKLPAINTDAKLVRGMELQVKLQEERGLDVVEFEAWMEEERRCIKTGFTGAPFYSSEEWFVLTGREDGGLCAEEVETFWETCEKDDSNEPF